MEIVAFKVCEVGKETQGEGQGLRRGESKAHKLHGSRKKAPGSEEGESEELGEGNQQSEYIT